MRARSFIIAVFLMMLSISLPAQAQESTSVTVSGNTTGWIRTGVRLQVGDIFTIVATGTVNIWPNCEETKAREGFPDLDCRLVQQMGPNGTTAFSPAEEDYPYPGALVGALVGRIGQGEPFLIGTGGTFTAKTAGQFRLAFNDIAYMEDNRGAFEVQITFPEAGRVCGPVEDWIDLGVTLLPGQAYTVKASGTIDIWPNCEATKADEGYPDLDCDLVHGVGPGGTSVFDPALQDYPLPGAPVASLIGRINDGEPFLIGEGGSFVAETGGTLQVRTNDVPEFLQDDQGCFSGAVVAEPEGEVILVPGTLNDWLDTGIMLDPGSTAIISASGVLNIWPNCEETKAAEGLPDVDCSKMRFGPVGTEELDLAPEDYPLPGGRVGALVGRFGDGEPFLVGSGGTFIAAGGGELRLRINDIVDMDDNIGGFIAIVNMEADAGN